MTGVFDDLIQALKMLVPEFKIISAVIHFDESSPHLQLVGIPISTEYIKGPKKQVAKTKIFTQHKLAFLQDDMHKKAQEIVNKHGLDITILPKQKGRNFNIPKQHLDEYYQLLDQKQSLVDECSQLVQKRNNLAKTIADMMDPKRTAPIQLKNGTEIIPLPELMRRTKRKKSELDKISLQCDSVEVKLAQKNQELEMTQKQLLVLNDEIGKKSELLLDENLLTEFLQDYLAEGIIQQVVKESSLHLCQQLEKNGLLNTNSVSAYKELNFNKALQRIDVENIIGQLKESLYDYSTERSWDKEEE